MSKLDIFNMVGTICSIIGLFVAFYSLWLVKGIDERLDEYKERRTYLDKRDDFKQIVTLMRSYLDDMTEHTFSQSRTKEQMQVLLGSFQQESNNLRSIMIYFEHNKELMLMAKEITDIDAKTLFVDNKSKVKARAEIADQKARLTRLEKRFEDELDRMTQ